MKSTFLIILGLGLLLTSCMRVSDLNENQAFLSPGNLDRTLSQVKRAPFFTKGNWPDDHWWTQFQNDQLNMFVQEALANNPTISAVEQKIEISIQEAKQAKSPLFPSVFFKGEQDWGRLSKNGIPYLFNPSLGQIYDLVQMRFSFDYEFDFWGKNRNRLQAALGEVKAQQAEYAQVKLMISSAVAKAYFAWQTNLKRKAFLMRLYKLKDKQLLLIDSLNQSGMLSRMDPATLSQEKNRIDQEIEKVSYEIQSNLHTLNLLRGKPVDTFIASSEQLKPAQDFVQLPKQINSDLIIRRPSLVASIWRIQSLVHRVNVAIADFFPQINLVGFLGQQSFPFFKHFLDLQSFEARLKPSFHIPVFKAGSIKANLKKNQKELEKAIYEYNELLLQSFKEAADSINWVASAYEQQNAQSTIVAEAFFKLGLQKDLYAKGISDLQSVYVYKEALYQEKIKEVLLIYQQYSAVIRLMESLGGGYQNQELSEFTGGENG